MLEGAVVPYFKVIFQRLPGVTEDNYENLQSGYPVSLPRVQACTITISVLSYLVGSPSERFPRGFPISILYAFLVFHILATCPANRSLLDLIRLYGLVVLHKSPSISLCT
jgi:hypothetical protein